jgi:hypothetical protein
MKPFHDNANRTWTVTINVDAIKRVRSLLGINLLTVLDDGCKLLAELHDDPILLVDVLYCLCKPQADTQNVSDEDFGRAMFGDAILHAHTALIEELADFFPSARQRAAIRKVIGKTTQVVDRLLDHAELKIDEVDVDAVAQKLIASFGNSPASSDSTPDG